MAHPPNPPVVGPQDAWLELGRTEAAQGKFERALESLGRAAEMSDARGCVWARAVLERGKIFDRRGGRERALAEYEKVIRRATDGELRRQAHAYRKRPYRPAAKKN